MKKIILVLIGIITISCSKVSKTAYQIGEEKAFLIITENTTKTELTKIVSEFKTKKNISVDFSKSTFSEDGTIIDLYMIVDCNDGYKGTASCSDSVLKNINYGFERDYTQGTEKPFSVGTM